MNITPFPLINIVGDARERGKQYGQLAASRIEQTLRVYREDFEHIGTEVVRRLASRFATRIGAYDPDLLAEIEGIADGSRHPVEDIIAINARTEILYGLQSAGRDPAAVDDGCTAVAALPDVTSSGNVIHAQNWDWRDDCYDCVVVVRAQFPDGMTLLTMAEAGMLARCGLNSAGIALTGNFLKCELDNGDGGIPVPCVRRRVLTSAHLRDAIGEVISAPRSFSNNMMISHSDGDAIDLETTPGPVFWLQPDRGLLVHANHFLSMAAMCSVRDLGLEVSPDSLYRQRRVEDFLRSRGPKLRPVDICAALSDRAGAPFGVCRDVTDGPGGRRVSTVATIVMDARKGSVWIAPTPYRKTQFFEYSLRSDDIKPSNLFDLRGRHPDTVASTK